MNRSFKQTLLPGRIQIFLFILLSILILTGAHYSLILGRVLQTLSVRKQDFYSAFDMYVTYAVQSDISYYLLIGLFWFGVGLLVYLGMWIAGNLLVEVRNVIVYERYYVNKASLLELIASFSSRMLLAIAIIAMVIISSVYGMPLWFSLFSRLLFGSVTWVNGLLVVSSVAGLAFNLYLVWVVYKVFRLVNQPQP